MVSVTEFADNGIPHAHRAEAGQHMAAALKFVEIDMKGSAQAVPLDTSGLERLTDLQYCDYPRYMRPAAGILITLAEPGHVKSQGRTTTFEAEVADTGTHYSAEFKFRRRTLLGHLADRLRQKAKPTPTYVARTSPKPRTSNSPLES